MAFNPFLNTQLRDQLAQGANVGDKRSYMGTSYDWTGEKWNPSGGQSGGGSMPTLEQAGGSTMDFINNKINPIEDKAIDDYVGALKSRMKPMDVFQQLEGMAGLPEMKKSASTIRQQVFDLEDTIRRIEPDISARSQSSLVTEAQRRRMVTSEKEPLTENLGWLSQSLGRVDQAIGNATADVTNKAGLVMKGQEMDIEPFKLRLETVKDRAARMITGFTSDRQANLELLLAKYNRDNQLADREWQLMAELAKEERSFEQQKSMTKWNQANGKLELIDLGGKTIAIDPFTGDIKQTYAESAKPSSASGLGSAGNPLFNNSGWELID